MQWFEDEDFWRELYPYMFAEERFAATPAQVDQIINLCGFAGRTVLDLCCGPGRHSVEFARRGFEVTGVDRTPFLLARARERAAEAGVQVEWVEEDMRRFHRPASFDLACSLFTSFGYFERDEDNFQILRKFHENLRAGGVLIMEMKGKEALARAWKDSFCAEFGNGSVLLQRPQLRDDCSRICNQWTVLKKDGTFRTFVIEHWVYSGRELKERLLDSGFQAVQLYGDVAGAPFNIDATRLVAVAWK